MGHSPLASFLKTGITNKEKSPPSIEEDICQRVTRWEKEETSSSSAKRLSVKSKVLWCFILKLESRQFSADSRHRRLSPKFAATATAHATDEYRKNTAGMAMRRPREYGDKETKREVKVRKFRKLNRRHRAIRINSSTRTIEMKRKTSTSTRLIISPRKRQLRRWD